MHVHRIGVVAVMLLFALRATAQSPEWRSADPEYEWSFPQDHWPHPGYKTEWWYLTGQLATGEDQTPRFGYQFTIFKIGVLPEPVNSVSSWSATDVLMGHAAITDLSTGQHLFSEILHRAAPLLAEFHEAPNPRIARALAPPGTSGDWTLDWNGAAFDFGMADDTQRFSLTLATRPEKPLVLQGPNGYSRKAPDPGRASLYYSFPRLDTGGTLRMGDSTFVVQGTSWMDKEFSSDPLAENQSGWDWFSIQLHDGRDLMLFMLRGQSDEIDFAHATVISQDGRPRYLRAEQWSAEPSRLWRSPTTDARYPLEWRVELPDEEISLYVEPLLDDQENVSRLVTDLFYWEGAIVVKGPDDREIGRGYLELTGYGSASRPAL